MGQHHSGRGGRGTGGGEEGREGARTKVWIESRRVRERW